MGSRRIIDDHVVREYGEGTSHHHYDVLERSAVGDWYAEKVATGLKSLPEVRATIREHNAEVRERNGRK